MANDAKLAQAARYSFCMQEISVKCQHAPQYLSPPLKLRLYDQRRNISTTISRRVGGRLDAHSSGN